jgi:hypothetical protein
MANETPKKVSGLDTTTKNALKAAVELTAKTRIYTMGDSLTARGYYQSKLLTLLGDNYDVVNIGIGGNNTSSMSDRFTNDVITPDDGKYVCIWGGINNVISSDTAVNIQNQLQAMYTAAHNAGLVVIAINITPFKGDTSWSAPRQIVLDAVNTWISATAINIDYVIDAYTLLESPNDADYINPLYAPNGEYLHYNQAGGDVLATAIHTAVTWIHTVSYPTIRSTNKDIILNQSLTTSDKPKFAGLTIGAGNGDSPAFKIEPGSVSAATVIGSIESDGDNLYFVIETGSVRRKIMLTSTAEDVLEAEKLNILVTVATKIISAYLNTTEKYKVEIDGDHTIIEATTNRLHLRDYTHTGISIDGGKVGIGKTVPTSVLDVVGYFEYADNTAALAAGLTAGAHYRTGDLLKVVH